ncbi:MAG: type IV pilus secretin PilQ [Candidatus Omnitrophica bacterium]|nr:type IV pilus secretin PilQ [Candidatus Omnitrophota bacterium]
MDNSKLLTFKNKILFLVLVLILAVGSFLAANQINEMQVEDTQTGNISVEFKDADIQDVFRVLALKGSVSIVADPDVKGLVTVQITDVPWEKVLDVICRTYGYAYERETNIIRVTTLDKQGQENLVTEVFTLNYAKASDVATSLSEMRSERGKIKFDSRANLVIVTDIPTNIYKISKVIERLDSMTPQVTIEARIMETTFSNIKDLGLKWNASYNAKMSSRPTSFPWPANNVGAKYGNYMPKGDAADSFPSITNPSFPLSTAADYTLGILDGSSFSLLLEAIETNGKTKILSNPSITTLDNEMAEIHVGTDWPIANYSYSEEQGRFVISGWEYKSYGILLRVTPTINKNGYVTLKLHPEISDKQEEIEFEGARVPVLSTQTADATVMIKDGETLVIGGLIKDKTIETKTKIPFLGDIPILGVLFQHKANEIVRNNLLIFITPHIVKENSIVKRKKISEALDSAVTDLSTVEEDMAELGMEDVVKAEEADFLKADMFDKELEEIRKLERSGAADTQEADVTGKAATALTESPEEVMEKAAEKKPDTVSQKKTDEEEERKNKGYLFRK